ncbi:MAG TPA: alternative ribosome rescue aminoacyl-tRNA hydrolase ArfB [Gammaproteobacteria bacterium]|nr:alternative ribosome rescue aminoacyl-tRNA hydrolase ArfB [Gammaproteobacteria bacterium]
MLRITPSVWLDTNEISITFVRSPGPGGQNVNKVATAALLRFNIRTSTSLPEDMRARLLFALAPRLTQQGDLIIKASRFRTQEMNRQDALDRLAELLQKAAIPPKPRKKTKPTRSSVQKRLEKKKLAGAKKKLRGRIDD